MFKHFQVSDFLLGLVAETSEKTVAQHTPVFVHEDLFASVDIDKHRDYIRGSTSSGHLVTELYILQHKN